MSPAGKTAGKNNPNHPLLFILTLLSFLSAVFLLFIKYPVRDFFFYLILALLVLTISLCYLILLGFARQKDVISTHYCRECLGQTLKTHQEMYDYLHSHQQITRELADLSVDIYFDELLDHLQTKLDEFKQGLVTIEKILKENPEANSTTPTVSQLKFKNHLNINLLLAQIMEINYEFKRKYQANFTESHQIYHSMAVYIYHMANLIPIINDFSQSTNSFSRDIIVDVITNFEHIADFSTRITDDIQKSMQNLMDANREDSLAYIVQQAHQVVLDFEEFFKRMEQLKSVSDNFVSISIDKLSHISEIALSIEDISETIKVLSLNVSIEAANTGTSARGFQVLARDLREFAQKTLKFAGDVKTQVQDTITTTTDLKGNYQESMSAFYKYVESLKNSIISFETIIQHSFTHIQAITQTLKEFSANLGQNVKNIIGKLQYQDITNQEVDHIAQFIRDIFEMANQEIQESRVVTTLEPEKRQEIRSEILKSIDSIITTSNERKILEEYEEIYDVSLETTEILYFSQQIAEQEQENIIIF